jgi:hypothetical protein
VENLRPKRKRKIECREEVMMLEQVRQLLRRKPFKPFRVVLKSGERHDIDDPDRIALGKSLIHWFPQGDKRVQLSVNEIELVYEPRQARH